MVGTALSLIGLPALNGFVGEFLVLSGSFGVHTYWTAAATLGVILSAVYMLPMLQRVLYSEPLQSRAGPGADPNRSHLREQTAMWPMVVLFALMGVLSPYWMRAIDGAVGQPLAVAHAQAKGAQMLRRIAPPQPRPSKHGGVVRIGQ